MPDDNGVKPISISDVSHSAHDRRWEYPLIDDDWEGEHGRFGEAHLCVTTKRWANGTVDVLVAHLGVSPPIAYAHRHPAPGVTSLITYGPVDDVVGTVINKWELPI